MTRLDELQAALQKAWGPDTCYPDSRDTWHPDNPARDQCGMTALVVHDILGGDIVLGEVRVAGRKGREPLLEPTARR